MRKGLSLSCVLTVGAVVCAGGARAEPRAQQVGLIGKIQQRFHLRQALGRARLERHEERQLSGQLDGNAPGMRGMLDRVRGLALDRTLWRETRYVAADHRDGAATLQLLDGGRREIGRIDVAWSAKGSYRPTSQVRVVNHLSGASGSYLAQGDRLRGELEVKAVLGDGRPRVERTERSFLTSLDGGLPRYRMGFGWVTVGDGPRVGYRHRDGRRVMQWPAPVKGQSPAPVRP